MVLIENKSLSASQGESKVVTLVSMGGLWGASRFRLRRVCVHASPRDMMSWRGLPWRLCSPPLARSRNRCMR